MSMKMEVYLFDHFVIIRNLYMLVHLFVEQKMQLVVYKQHQFNLNPVSTMGKNNLNNRIFHIHELIFILLTYKDVLLAKQKKKTHTFLKFHLPPYCNLIESSLYMLAYLKGNVNIIIICFIVYTRQPYG